MKINSSTVALVKSLTTFIAKQIARRLAGFVVALSLVLGSAGVHAWGSQGHQVVAGLALAQLTPKARAEVDRLLAQ